MLTTIINSLFLINFILIMSSCFHYCSYKTPQEKLTNPDWMKYIPNKLISEMTIPGTHDTCARINILEYIQTQSWQLSEQLKAGIRFLDIRCFHYENRFEIHHDMFYCGLSFTDVLNIIKDFFSSYPSEAIIMRVHKEFREIYCSRSFEETFMDYFNSNKDLIHVSRGIPYLNEIRSKIWVILDFENKISGFQWANAIIQDSFYLSSLLYIYVKIELIREHFTKAIEGDMNELYINFCSGVGLTCWPFVIADYTNKVPLELKGRLGIVIMDFPGEHLIKHLILQNYVVEEDWVIVEKDI
jgi:1-phosphatidylinositol phosphodiesterase